jgi:hypothetical protein
MQKEVAMSNTLILNNGAKQLLQNIIAVKEETKNDLVNMLLVHNQVQQALNSKLIEESAVVNCNTIDYSAISNLICFLDEV